MMKNEELCSICKDAIENAPMEQGKCIVICPSCSICIATEFINNQRKSQCLMLDVVE
jgi:hypothetical protein